MSNFWGAVQRFQTAFLMLNALLNLDFIRRKGLPFVAGRAVPEEDLGFEVAVAAAVHNAFLQLAADNGTNHIGIGFPPGFILLSFKPSRRYTPLRSGFWRTSSTAICAASVSPLSSRAFS